VLERAGKRVERLVPFDTDRAHVSAARRNPRSFETLYRKYVGQVYSFALYELRNHHAAEDVTELVFLRALRGLARFEERGDYGASTVRAWLFSIARNAIANERRRARRHPEAPLEAAGAIHGPLDVAATAVTRDEASRAWRAVARLSDDRRRVVVLRFVNELPTAEIARILGRSEGAVRVLLHRALRSVADELGAARNRQGPAG
jgi:RNA polymerase sigma-70 factor (ECF subfamily)